MNSGKHEPRGRPAAWVAGALVTAALPALSGCAVLAAGGAVVGAAISVTGAVVSTGVELTGKAIGAGVDAMSGDDEADDSGIVIKYTERPASGAVPLVSSSRPAPVPEPVELARPSPVR